MRTTVRRPRKLRGSDARAWSLCLTPSGNSSRARAAEVRRDLKVPFDRPMRSEQSLRDIRAPGKLPFSTGGRLRRWVASGGPPTSCVRILQVPRLALRDHHGNRSLRGLAKAKAELRLVRAVLNRRRMATVMPALEGRGAPDSTSPRPEASTGPPSRRSSLPRPNADHRGGPASRPKPGQLGLPRRLLG